KAAIHDQFKTGHTLEAVQDIGCSILPPAAEASLFLCANCVGRISERAHDAAGDRAWRLRLRCRPAVFPSPRRVGLMQSILLCGPSSLRARYFRYFERFSLRIKEWVV